MPYTSKQKAGKLSLMKGLFIPLIVLAAISLTMIGCGKDGVLETISKPVVIITSYEGVESDTLVTDPYFFQRRIFWRGESPRGVVTGFAYRVLDENGTTPVNTPKTYVDPNGWLYHYKPGADQSIPLEGDPESEKVRTIWTTKVFDTIHFPATINGDSTAVTSIFEIKCKDHYDQESEIVRRYFNVVSHVPDVDIIFSDRFRPLAAAQDPENPIFRTIGLGIEIEFEIAEFTPYTTPQNTPNYFMFYVEKRYIPAVGNGFGELIERFPREEGEWYDTRNQSNIRRIWLAQESDNIEDFGNRDDVHTILNPDTFTNNNWKQPETETILFVKAVNMANVHSPERFAKFRVYENFRPTALVYKERTNVLGKNHFTTYHHTSIQRLLPEAETVEGRFYGTPFFVQKDGRLGALWSDDIKIYLRWGWKGQFEDNDPDKGFINEVHDVNTGSDYLANVKAFDLRLGDEPYPYQPLIKHPEYDTRFRHIDPDGTEWLRVPRNFDREIDTRALLTSIPPGEYKLSIRVVDSQNKTSAPSEFDFSLEPKVERKDKKGILVIENETFPIPAVKDYISQFYQEIIDGTGISPVDVIDRRKIRDELGHMKMHPANVFLSPTDLEKYRLVIWHADNPVASGDNDGNFHQEYEVMNLYLRGGGNVLVSAGSNFRVMKASSETQGFYNPTFEKYFGLSFGNQDVVKVLSGTYFGPTALPYMTGAKPVQNSPVTLPNIDVEWEHPYLSILKNTQGITGLGPISYFDDEGFADENTTVLYRMQVNEAGVEYEGKPVAIRRRTTNNSTYVFGFPLSFMEKDKVLEMIEAVYNDVLSAQ